MYGALLTELESGATVVTANNRLARTLRHAYDQQAIVNGLQAWATPQILSWSQWMRRLWDESRLRGGVASDLRLLEDSATILLWQDAIRSADPNAVVLPVTQLARGLAAPGRSYTTGRFWMQRSGLMPVCLLIKGLFCNGPGFSVILCRALGDQLRTALRTAN